MKQEEEKRLARWWLENGTYRACYYVPGCEGIQRLQKIQNLSYKPEECEKA